MKEISVKMYQAEDGTVFDTRKKANEHDKKKNQANRLAKLQKKLSELEKEKDSIEKEKESIEKYIGVKKGYKNVNIGGGTYERSDGTSYSYNKWGGIVNDTGHDRAF